MKAVVERVRKESQLTLFGLDSLLPIACRRITQHHDCIITTIITLTTTKRMSVVAERETGVLYVVDINYFPGYAGVPDFPAMMTRYGMEWYCIACQFD